MRPLAPFEAVHGRYVHSRRVRVLAERIATLIPRGASVLDVGCGDGQLAAHLGSLRPDLTIEGVDVLVRPGAAIPVRSFDGTHLPLSDGSVDVALAVDVLHHASELRTLLADMMRVGRRIVIKDHTREGLLARETLTLMDYLGNARHGVALPCEYLAYGEWQRLFRELRLQIETWIPSLPLYPFPASLVFGRRLHFLAALSAGGTERPDTRSSGLP